MQRRPTVGPGSQWTPFRRWLPGTISKLGKGATLQRGQTWGGGVGALVVVGGMMGMGGSGKGKARVCGSGDDNWNGPGLGRHGRGRGSGRWSGGGSGVCGSGVRGNVSGV